MNSIEIMNERRSADPAPMVLGHVNGFENFRSADLVVMTDCMTPEADLDGHGRDTPEIYTRDTPEIYTRDIHPRYTPEIYSRDAGEMRARSRSRA